MSIKTLRKRIALVAVSALGVGLLSVAPASAAVAAGDFEILNTAADKLALCSVDAAGDIEYAFIPVTSTGITIGDVDAVDNETAYVRVSGPGTIVSTTEAGGNIDAVSTTVIDITDIDADDTEFVVKPTGVGTITITYGATSTSALVDSITLYVVSTCAGDKVSAADSYFTIVTAAEAAGGGAWTDTPVNSTGASVVANAGKGYGLVRIYDEYGDVLSTAGALIATATGPCLVNLEAAGGALAKGSGATAVLATTADDVALIVSQATADIGGTCVVTMTFNGVSLGSETFLMQGAPSKITVSDQTIGAVGGVGFYRVSVQDAAGNYIPGLVVSYSATEANNVATALAGIVSNPQENSLAQTSSTAGSTYGKTEAVTGANIAAWADEDAANMTAFSCADSGTAKITVRVPKGDGISYVTSDPFTVACGDVLDKWTISMDKAVYAPGEVATLTVTGKDSSGNPVASTEAIAGYAGSFGGMTFVTTPVNGDTFSSGIGTRTYTLSVGTTEGAFVGTFKITGDTDTAAKTVQYKVVAPSTGAVTNAEVLAAIVKLIASINKQIRALQKSLKK